MNLYKIGYPAKTFDWSLFLLVSEERDAEFVELGVPTQMRIYLKIAEIRRQQKKSGTFNDKIFDSYKRMRKDALSYEVEGDFWCRPLMRSTLNNQVPNRNVLVTGQRINFDRDDFYRAGGFSKIYKHKLNSSYEAVFWMPLLP